MFKFTNNNFQFFQNDIQLFSFLQTDDDKKKIESKDLIPEEQIQNFLKLPKPKVKEKG